MTILPVELKRLISHDEVTLVKFVPTENVEGCREIRIGDAGKEISGFGKVTQTSVDKKKAVIHFLRVNEKQIQNLTLFILFLLTSLYRYCLHLPMPSLSKPTIERQTDLQTCWR